MAERAATKPTSIYHTKPQIISDKVYGGCGYPLLTFKGQEAANALLFTSKEMAQAGRGGGVKVLDSKGLSRSCVDI
uniref:Uncharacterized protein n=1 Tax=Salix viminalis TaxID=40686 RepID=A0A6N2N8F3_SALVM